MAALALASFAKLLAYELFLAVHVMSAAVLAFLLLSQLLADSTFNRLPVYVYGGISALLNLAFLCRYGYNNFAGWHRPRLVYSEIAASRIHGKRWLHLELQLPRRVVLKPGQYISLWIPGVQLFSSHPFTATATDALSTTKAKEDAKTDALPTTEAKEDTATAPAAPQTVFHIFIDSRKGISKSLIKPFLSLPRTADKLEKQRIQVAWDADGGSIAQTNQPINQNAVQSRFALFTGPHGRTVDHRSFETVVLVASGLGYWSVDAHLEDMLRTGCGGTRTRDIVLIYKGIPRTSPLYVFEAYAADLRKKH